MSDPEFPTDLPEGATPDTKATTIKRIGGNLHRVIPILDKSGKVLSFALKPLMVEFKPRDVLQVMVGAMVLALPVSMSEEAWTLAEELPLANIAMLGILSNVFVGLYVYFNFYKGFLSGHGWDFVKRVLGTYFISLAVVGLLLTILQKCPWGVDNVLALKRMVVVALPACMSATISDTLK